MNMDNNATVDRSGRSAGWRTERFGQVLLPCPEFNSMEWEAQSDEESRREEPDTADTSTHLDSLATDKDSNRVEFESLR